jgi:tetratricopeptide (TPR) repeat protein
MNVRKYKLVFYLIFFLAGWSISGRSQVRPTQVDSSFWSLSLPELQSYRAFYTQELEMLQEEKQSLIRRGISDGERLLQVQPDGKVVDEILIRLADLYYYQEKDQYLTKMQAYDEKLMQHERGELQELPEEPRPDYQKSMAIYQRIIDEFPKSELVDDAVYNRGFIFEELGEHQKANQIYLHLIEAYPESHYVPECYLRLGEYYFNPPLNNVNQAIAYYKRVLQYKNSPRYDEALYKLGWSYYRLSQYPESISYFTMLVEGMGTGEETSGTESNVRTELHEEALAYIAISFIDFGGPENANAYVEKVGNPQWGLDMLAKLGDIYMQEKEEYLFAIKTYELLLDKTYSTEKGPVYQKKIVDCYQALQDEKKTFEMRQRLYEMYKPDGIWWKATEDEKAKLQSRRFTEQALRENVGYVIRQAEVSERMPLFEKAVEMGEIYLTTYPEDIHAYMIRWNVALILDTKLKRYKEAFEEYLTISLVYNTEQYAQFAREKGLSDIRDAAENAIIVADSLVQQELKSGTEMDHLSRIQTQMSKDIKEFIPFSPANALLAVAYDNYIKLFPFDEKTAMILANAGALYYTHNQFDEALKYFKTLVDYFPNSDEVRNVQYSILESYFGKGDYQSSEVLAKKMLSGSGSDEIKQKAESRLAESIFLKAETFSKTNQAKTAADEYYRMALEVPTSSFVDRALFNAGKEYDQIHDYQSAIRAYEHLRASYSGSSLLLDALNNLAFDYGETGDYQKAGERYESLAEQLNYKDKAKDALYNAFVFYGKAGNALKAVETGEKYAVHFPEAEDAPQVYLQTAVHREEMGDLTGAIRVYSDFASRFPDSPLSVESYYRLGQVFQKSGSLSHAETAFRNAYQRSLDLKAKKLDENSYFASEGLFCASQLIQNRYNQILFKLPPQNINQELQTKQQLLQQLVDQYTTVAGYHTFRLPESIFQIGALYDNFAATWAGQEIPFLDATSRAVKEKEINERTSRLYAQALAAFMKAVEGLEKMTKEPFPGSIQTTDTTSATGDTLQTLIHFWADSAKIKISETLYQLAEINTKTIDQLLAAPVPVDMSDMAKLEYQSQVLAKAIRPTVQVVMNAHIRNLHVADSLSLKNRWTEASQNQLLSIAGLLGREYEQLAFRAVRYYQNDVKQYQRKTLNKKETVSEKTINEMIQYIEAARSYSSAAVISYRDGVLACTERKLPNFNTALPQEEMIGFSLRMADTLETLIQNRLNDQFLANNLFQKKGDLFYEDALSVFEDHVFYLDQNIKMLLTESYKAEERFPLPSPSIDWLKIKMVLMEPETYVKKLKMHVETATIPVDTTWWYSPRHQDGWASVQFQMNQWNHPKRESASSNRIKGSKTVLNGSTAPETSFYLRKIIEIPGLPISNLIELKTNSKYELVVNDRKIPQLSEDESRMITHALHQGRNLVGIHLPGKDDFMLEGSIKIQYIVEQNLPKARISNE